MSDKDMNADHEVYKTLLESTQAIPWRIDWQTLTFSYIGPQIESLLGWPQDSWLGIDDWAERMHPEDRQRVVNFCVSQSKSGVDHEADYRALTAAGDYVWIRDVVHVIRKDGEVEALVGFMFDISERKKTEQQLVEMQRKLEELSFKDGLTGVANRRMFDAVLEREWSRAQQERQPLSLILLDIDFFKQYNDHYGHIMGDDCLKQVATVLGSSATRFKDLFARYGGEEFVWILPETDLSAAKSIADRCVEAVAEADIPHEVSPCSRLTLSLGVDSVIPAAGASAQDFLAQVDRLLYRAKQLGRNRVCPGDLAGA